MTRVSLDAELINQIDGRKVSDGQLCPHNTSVINFFCSFFFFGAQYVSFLSFCYLHEFSLLFFFGFEKVQPKRKKRFNLPEYAWEIHHEVDRIILFRKKSFLRFWYTYFCRCSSRSKFVPGNLYRCSSRKKRTRQYKEKQKSFCFKIRIRNVLYFSVYILWIDRRKINEPWVKTKRVYIKKKFIKIVLTRRKKIDLKNYEEGIY